MTTKPLTIRQHVERGHVRAACGVCRWVGDWRDGTYFGGRSKALQELDQHLIAAHGRKPVPR